MYEIYKIIKASDDHAEKLAGPQQQIYDTRVYSHLSTKLLQKS